MAAIGVKIVGMSTVSVVAVIVGRAAVGPGTMSERKF
jgi:hypothetical protein